ncbi:hypothetical protein SAMN05444678_12426 [Sphingomonas sp. YR710]|uniref:hypothetical protein n=1 Tax=Sphingomonas sp. YR710 TaxID=1882773 RepID=UPI00088E3AB6|nr:hypothetical protein [Sphingomonas sp. YR710]SDD82348.1 hypothetical protein SAMN05444678_12426 [Sphingomonas sp. YR710]
MEDYRSFSNDAASEWDFPDIDEPAMDPPPVIGTDERRMHVRAYEHWVSLLAGRPYPDIADLDAAMLGEFTPHSVLLDFSDNPANPRITFLGRALREEGGLGPDIETVADVPARSLVSRLTDHYTEILENRAPVGFEAEFVSHRNQQTLYRGILMPYSSDGAAIDFIHGVINWKLSADNSLPADIVAAVTTAFAGPAQPEPDPLPDWTTADEAAILGELGQSEFGLSEFGQGEFGDALSGIGLEELIEDARELALEARDSETRSHAALYRALSITYDIVIAALDEPVAFDRMIEAAGIVRQERAPMTPVVKLVFGRDYDRKRIAEYAAVLRHAQRLCLTPGMVEQWIAGIDGGIKAIVAAERQQRQPALKVDRAASARRRLHAAPPIATIDGDGGALADAGGEEFVLLVARRDADGRLAIVAPVTGDPRLLDRALNRAAPPEIA